jgi:hypothetical protein
VDPIPGAEESDARWLDLLESFGEVERWTSLAFVAGRQVALAEDERNEALRRALVVRAVGGDPHRELSLDEDAVTRLADELDSPERREQLLRAVADIGAVAADRPTVGAAVARLVSSPDLAWRAFCGALLAAELSEN